MRREGKGVAYLDWPSTGLPVCLRTESKALAPLLLLSCCLGPPAPAAAFFPPSTADIVSYLEGVVDGRGRGREGGQREKAEGAWTALKQRRGCRVRSAGGKRVNSVELEAHRLRGREARIPRGRGLCRRLKLQQCVSKSKKARRGQGASTKGRKGDEEARARCRWRGSKQQ